MNDCSYIGISCNSYIINIKFNSHGPSSASLLGIPNKFPENEKLSIFSNITSTKIFYILEATIWCFWFVILFLFTVQIFTTLNTVLHRFFSISTSFWHNYLMDSDSYPEKRWEFKCRQSDFKKSALNESTLKMMPACEIWLIQIKTERATSMLVKGVGDQMCCWQVWDVYDRFSMLVTDLIHWGNHQHNEKSHSQKVTNISNQSPS